MAGSMIELEKPVKRGRWSPKKKKIYSCYGLSLLQYEGVWCYRSSETGK
jgi:hypothetical protein